MVKLIDIRPTAMFVGCFDNIHAGVIMGLISGGVSAEGTARAVVRSTLTGEVRRVNPMLIVPIRGMSDDAVGDLLLDVACDCVD